MKKNLQLRMLHCFLDVEDSSQLVPSTSTTQFILKCHLLKRLIPNVNEVCLLCGNCTLDLSFTILLSLFVIKNVMI